MTKPTSTRSSTASSTASSEPAAATEALLDLTQLQTSYVSEATALWNQAVGSWMQNPFAGAVGAASSATGSEAGKSAASATMIGDKRFSAQPWQSNPGAAFVAQMYLLNARTMLHMAEAAPGDAKARARVRFAVQQWVDAASPSNVLALNPEAIDLAVKTKGESLSKGLAQLLADVQKGRVSQTDESAFEPGRNIATTEGAVVFENDLMQLIEYKPLTAQVYERPLLLVPPCINKFYILDLQPENSLVRHAVAQGHRVFMLSWRNPDASLAHKTWDDYIEEGPIAALKVIQAITGAQAVNTLGFCVGGTILSTALAVLVGRGKQAAHSLTLLTTLLDFSETGVLDLFIDETSVAQREQNIGATAPGGPKLLQGKELATTFSFLRPNDLVWNYVVGNYLKGESPPPFDLLYWNGDSTNLPGPMYCWYLRHTYLQNELRVPGKLTVCGQKVDLSRITVPSFVYASREDHIVPWESAYQSLGLLGGPTQFVLGASGHIAGVINPPAKGKRSHWVAPASAPAGASAKLGKGKAKAGTKAARAAQAKHWFDAAQEVPGSWWPQWDQWLGPLGGKRIAAPRSLGSKAHRAIEPAPGRYVKAKA